jgi:hypothetical protein
VTSSTGFGASTFNGSMVTGQTVCYLPKASLLRTAGPPVSNMHYGQPKGAQQDEGKMSVSIDFGTIFALDIVFAISLLSCPRYDILWCCEFRIILDERCGC